jgi:cytochrome c-type biogenesis protein CcsB
MRPDGLKPLLKARQRAAGMVPGTRAFVALCALLVMMMGVRVWGMDQAKPDEARAAAPAPGSMAPGAADPHGGMFGGLPDMGAVHQQLAARYASQDRSAFEKGIALGRLRLLAVMHADTVKILDSWARQTNSKIRNRQTINGKDPLYVALDIALRPEAWADQNIVYVQAVPVREQLASFAHGADDLAKRTERDRIMHEGLVSPNFLVRPEVIKLLESLQLDSRRADAVNKVFNSLQSFGEVLKTLAILPPAAGVNAAPPGAGASEMDKSRAMWIDPMSIVTPPTLPGVPPAKADRVSPYSSEQTLKINLAFNQLAEGWQQNDVELANTGISGLVAVVDSMHAPGYPSEARRVTELWYNRSFNGTLVAFVYFAAMTLFLLVAVGVSPPRGKVATTALWFFGIALALHLAAMGVRWWLAGRIPIQNQFESVLGSACLGCIVGFSLERWKRNGIFGTAFSFVGFLAMTTCLAAPYVFGEEMRGASIAKVAGILSDIWLFIHVNIVIASYALISASFCIALIYLGLRQWYWVNPLEAGFEPEAAPDEPAMPGGGGGAPTDLKAVAAPASLALLESKRASTLDTLDQANMVVLQMATWFLGIGIICGAVWADHSWGRPWGWDPKETFALVTWIVYLLIVHIRFVTKSKADWSAWLAVAGFGVMMFNWIGVNFFLKGLHSYA